MRHNTPRKSDLKWIYAQFWSPDGQTESGSQHESELYPLRMQSSKPFNFGHPNRGVYLVVSLMRRCLGRERDDFNRFANTDEGLGDKLGGVGGHARAKAHSLGPLEIVEG